MVYPPLTSILASEIEEIVDDIKAVEAGKLNNYSKFIKV